MFSKPEPGVLQGCLLVVPLKCNSAQHRLYIDRFDYSTDLKIVCTHKGGKGVIGRDLVKGGRRGGVGNRDEY